MSRQFDQYMSDKFEIYGDLYSLIEPDNFDELMEALKVKDIIQNAINSLMHDEDSSSYCELLQIQEDYIIEYVSRLGEFENYYLIQNINYITKKNDLRIGELEKLLGISTGYISRTAKENSSKKMSVDVVWKIAKLFDVDIKTLIETDLRIPNTNTELIKKFIAKINLQTQENVIEWTSHGGIVMLLDERYKSMGLISEGAYETTIYHPDRLNQEFKWILTDDIVACEKFEGDRDLVIIPFMADGRKDMKFYDFLFVWSENKRYHWEKVFYTSDEPYGKLTEYASILYDSIQRTEFDAQITTEVRNTITNYLKGGI